MNRRPLPIALLVLAACSKPPRETMSYSYIDTTHGDVTIETEGIRIEVSGSVRYASYSVSSGAESASETTLEGHPFGLRDGVFFIGDSEYGPAPAGAVVRVNDEGVLVDGEKRGVVPEAAPEEPGE
jgi:hypothetical protein